VTPEQERRYIESIKAIINTLGDVAKDERVPMDVRLKAGAVLLNAAAGLQDITTEFDA
jgi:hypothetical protein